MSLTILATVEPPISVAQNGIMPDLAEAWSLTPTFTRPHARTISRDRDCEVYFDAMFRERHQVESNVTDAGKATYRQSADRIVSAPRYGRVDAATDLPARQTGDDDLRSPGKGLEATLAKLHAAPARPESQEGMAAIGQLTADIAHEIKNPLNFINNFASLTVELVAELEAELGPRKSPAIEETLALITRNLAIIGWHGQRTDRILHKMLLHA
jgi:signal transduction histidine kinase